MTSQAITEGCSLEGEMGARIWLVGLETTLVTGRVEASRTSSPVRILDTRRSCFAECLFEAQGASLKI